MEIPTGESGEIDESCGTDAPGEFPAPNVTNTPSTPSTLVPDISPMAETRAMATGATVAAVATVSTLSPPTVSVIRPRGRYGTASNCKCATCPESPRAAGAPCSRATHLAAEATNAAWYRAAIGSDFGNSTVSGLWCTPRMRNS